MKLSSSKLKPKIEPEPYITKKQRTKCRRKLRSQISPILISPLNPACPRKSSGFSASTADSCRCVGDEVSCDSSRVTVESRASKRKLREPGVGGIEEDPFRRITRSYAKQKESERKGNEVEVSELSCVESNSGAECVVSEKRRSSKLKKRTEKSKEIQIDEASVSVTKSEISSVQRNLEIVQFESKENDAVSIASGVESCLSNKTTEVGNIRARETELSEISKNDAVSISGSVVEQKPESSVLEADLSCAEHFSYDGAVAEYSSSHEVAISELHSELFLESSSDLDFSDYTPSIFLDSGSEFSEKSDDFPPSRTYLLLLEFRQQFSRSSVPLDMRMTSFSEAEYLRKSSFVRFQDEKDEESYQRFRERERRQLFLYDYVEFYRSTTEYGDLIFQQRYRMVHWIVEQSTAKEFQLETMFLGVSLLDRFLTKGFFKNKRSLQIVGIACLTLAARIEENQPYNTVRQKNFRIESNVYSRFEVVAMEWLVQEVLNFQCFLPTIQNFMWFYQKAARADAEVEKRARYLAKLALSDPEHLRYWPSTVAAGLVILASLESDQIESYQRIIEVHVRTIENDLHECIKTLEWLLQYVS
ncbi:hypothetical protein JCGZ_04794 [Jatropha curcas]|uniref:B-like cyclin n=1 Tax=Jatropha curcas TaxID=180498 RepID=A0A067KPL0_JATCU|nr:cyclin-SDS [Jatropha curcas]KDP38151.1 hypothetical protein JCGZ_04794 [Jatropha curcas]